MTKTRSPTITVEGVTYERLPIGTHVLTESDDIAEVAASQTNDVKRDGDILFVSEKVVAITQGRAPREADLKIGLTARLLWRFVQKSPHGVGLRRPSSMQCAVMECGAPRIWLAAFAGALGKTLGKRGWFYHVAGMQAATIDAAGTSPLQPDRVVMGPKDPDGVARRLRDATGLESCVVDVNDIGGSWVLGATDGVDRERVQLILKDNPLGQKSEQTPLGLIRVQSN
jgi:F420-0:gamma-glutamyl ligase